MFVFRRAPARSRVPRHRTPLTVFRRAACGLLPILAAAATPAAQDTDRVEEVIVRAERERGFDAEIDPIDSANAVGLDALRRSQSSDVFDVLRDIPGVNIEGGPRASGKVLSIRGFSSNEDVLIQIDGVTQNFEKYRYGSGIDIDPELLKEIAVFRGGTAITQGSGYLGGVVRMETKDAKDFLSGGRRFGAQSKVGYQSNNDGKSYSLTAYGAPTGFADALFSVTQRDTNDYARPDGSRYADSAESQLSALGKLEFFTESTNFTFSQRFGEDSGLEPFDVTGGASGIGGTVRRSSRELASSARAEWDPDSNWIRAGATLGFIDKNVTDEDSPIAGVDANGNPVGTDRFDYQIWTFDAGNVFEFGLGPTTHRADVGIQGTRERRVSERENLDGIGANPSQPSGEKQYYAAYAEHEVRWHGFAARGGLRRDWYEISPDHDVRGLLDARGLDETVTFARTTPGFALSFERGAFGVFYTWRKSFRAPLLDEYFARGTFSRCFEFSEFTRAPVAPVLVLPTAPVSPVVPDIVNFPGDVFGYLAALNQYNNIDLPNYLNVALPAYTAAVSAATSNYFAAFADYRDALSAFAVDPASQSNALCGDLYEPEEATTREAGFTLTLPDMLGAGSDLFLKLTYFDIRVKNVLESIYENAITHEVSQPGREVRKGFEFEIHYDRDLYYADFNLSTLDGYIEYNFFEDNIDPSIAAFGDPGRTALFNMPDDTASFVVGFRPPGMKLDIGHRLRLYGSRVVTVGTQPGCPGALFTNPVCNTFGTQSGYITSNFYVGWQPHPTADVRLTVDNALNKTFRNTGFGGAIGAIAPGRDIRLSLRLQY